MYSFFSSKSYGELKDPETYDRLKKFASEFSVLFDSENTDLLKLNCELFEFVKYVMQILHPPRNKH